MNKWPTHPNGRNKKVGEMTSGERRQVFADSCHRLKAELEHPAMQKAVGDYLKGKAS